MRIYELAKKWNLDSKEFVTQLQGMGYKVKNHMSSLDDELVQRIEKKISAAVGKPASSEATAKGAESKKSENVSPTKTADRPSQETSQKSEGFKPTTEKEVGSEEDVKGPFKVDFPITVGKLAEVTDINVATMIKGLMDIGVFANMNQLISEEIVLKIQEPLRFLIEGGATEDEEKEKKETDEIERLVDEDESKLQPRPPVVTLMGHVDHGKTSLLDAIRKSSVADREAGKITQHMGTYSADVPGKGHVTFLDTPGHEAFSAMRSRGAQVTDIVVLVVAADDGVMPQTVEAIHHAKSADVPIIVAVNKSDLPAANMENVKSGLQQHELSPEDWGGKTIFVSVSAKTGDGVDQLLEMLVLQSEVLELKANPDKLARATVLEGQLSKGRGPVATVLVQEGTLRVGDVIVCGPYCGKVRGMTNDHGKLIKTAGPSVGVEIQGLDGVPDVGDVLQVVGDEKEARGISERRQMKKREIRLAGEVGKHATLENLHEEIETGHANELRIIIKGDVQGSVEALTGSLEKLSTDKMKLRVIHGAVGGINESDVMLASASNAIIIGFHVKADLQAIDILEKEKIESRFYSIIYEAVEDVRTAMEGLLAPKKQEKSLGMVEIRDTFKNSKVGTIAGCHVVKGKITRNSKTRLIRDNIIVFEGRLSSLKRFKDDAKEVLEGYDCGASFQRFNDIKVGDMIEAYEIEEVAQKL
jgi:translation initiation factor IF-2